MRNATVAVQFRQLRDFALGKSVSSLIIRTLGRLRKSRFWLLYFLLSGCQILSKFKLGEELRCELYNWPNFGYQLLQWRFGYLWWVHPDYKLKLTIAQQSRWLPVSAPVTIGDPYLNSALWTWKLYLGSLAGVRRQITGVWDAAGDRSPLVQPFEQSSISWCNVGATSNREFKKKRVRFTTN